MDVKNKVIDLYSRLWLNYSTKGKLTEKDHLDGMSINTDFDKVVTKKKFKYVINIYKFPVDYNRDVETLLMQDMFDSYPLVDVVFNDYCRPFRFNLNENKHKKVHDEFSRREAEYKMYKEIFDSFSVAEQNSGKFVKVNGRYTKVNKRKIQLLEENFQSYEYIFNHKGSFFITHKHIEIASHDLQKLEEALFHVKRVLGGEKIEYKVLVGELNSYLSNFSFSGYKMTSNSQSIGMLMSDENLARQSAYAESGLVGNTGVYVGIDQRNKAPFFINFTEGTSGQNIGVLAKSGGGKTFATMVQIIGHLCFTNRFISIMDYKGTEYTHLLKEYNGIEINMKDRFVNFLDLSEIDSSFSYNEKIEFYDNAVRGTVSLFEAMVSLAPDEGSVRDLSNIINEAVQKAYSKCEVHRTDPNSYKNSKGLKYVDVSHIINGMSHQAQFSSDMRELCKKAVRRINEFVSPMGAKYHMFENELNFNSVLLNQLVIYNFDKNNDTEDFSISDNIRFIMMRFINNKKTTYIKRQKKFHVIVYEELQRSGDGVVLREVNHDVTGGRSSNKIVYLLFNSLGFLNKKGMDAQGIKENITTWFVGKIDLGCQKTLHELFGLENIRDDIAMIVNNYELYEKCFAVSIDTGVVFDKTFMKAELPTEYTNKEIFKTRDTEVV